ncbi:MAG: DUF1549 domain-containing protein [Acidobacteriota bacterium]
MNFFKLKAYCWGVLLFSIIATTHPLQGSGSKAALDNAPSFRNDVLPVLTKAGCNSGACHGALAGKNGFKLSLRGYDPVTDYQVLTREALGRRIVPTAPAHSLVLLKPTLTIPHGGGKRFETGSRDYQIIADWIASGTPPPSPDDPLIEEITVDPARVLVEETEKPLQLTVTARYSDGSKQDVTRWVKFSSTNQGVATVDENGLVTTNGPGESAISTWYSSKVSFARITVPYPHQLEASTFEGAPRNNYIDELVLKKLAELRIAPSGLCSDTEFIRRVYTDTLGVLPTVEEIDRFLSDASRNKREKLIDQVLQRPEYADYWSYKWSDLLLVSSRKLDRSAMQSYYSWIRDSIEANKPWDKFVSELVTATGNNFKNGAANYWVIHTDPIDITENLSKSFLGITITCARCHNHPLEKWTQDQYYSMANLVSRVSLKNGNLRGEFTVISSHMGEINHPRRNEPMPPQPLEGEILPPDSSKDRRIHLAEWLTSPDNANFARTVVNRVWANFMGRGLVEEVDDLRATNPASNEDLFADLTRDFVQNGYDIQHLIRTILNSATYQLSSQTNPSNAEDEIYYSHYFIRRLPAEVILDAYSQVTGVAAEFEGYPEGTRALELPDTQVQSYFLDSFGRPARITGGSDERMSESNVAQVLHLVNGDTLNAKLSRKGNVVDQLLEESSSSRGLIEQIYKRTLSRPPKSEELAQLTPMLEEPQRKTVEDLLWAILTSKEFLFKH